jgi:hypothetical protein
MFDYGSLFHRMERTALAPWAALLPGQLERVLQQRPHGDLLRWLDILRRLPALPPHDLRLDRDCVAVGGPATAPQQHFIRDLLQGLHPWRKGPFCVHGVHIDAEWRSDRKWARLRDAIAALDNRLVLDVGCGNGYYAWRMLGARAWWSAWTRRCVSSASTTRCGISSAIWLPMSCRWRWRTCRRARAPSIPCFPWACSITAARPSTTCSGCGTACARAGNWCWKPS